MTLKEQRRAAEAFGRRWSGKFLESQNDQKFWRNMLSKVFGVDDPDSLFIPQYKVGKNNKKIDLYFPKTKVIIEQKSSNENLDARKPRDKQGKESFTPFEQAKDYDNLLYRSVKAKWIIVSNFKEIRIHKMDSPDYLQYKQILLENFEDEFHNLKILIDEGEDVSKKEKRLSVETGTLTKEIYKELLNLYGNPAEGRLLNHLNQLCMRLVFCMFADKAKSNMFAPNQFFKYLSAHRNNPGDFRDALRDLFEALNLEPSERPELSPKEIIAFPKVNGGLFAEKIMLPHFSKRIIHLILDEACSFAWDTLSPTIFGNVFESTLNPETRASGGMHYTSVENIHKVIDPLFLNDLRDELERIKKIEKPKSRYKRLEEYQKKLGSLTFLDPACGSGNFLTETYISLRRLENEAMYLRNEFNPNYFNEELSPINVSIQQFYGIEINDFAVSVARTALWIAEAQMRNEMEDMLGEVKGKSLPLDDYENIHEGDALTIDWSSVISARRLDYIIGNPPFEGANKTKPWQKDELENLFGEDCTSPRQLDYVCGWYKKCSDFMGRKTRAALVSTNSICQGEQISPLWKTLMKNEVHIDFAYQSFKWENDAKKKAHVHCVIIGFSKSNARFKKYIFNEQGIPFEVTKINPYLIDCENIIVGSRFKPLCNVLSTRKGNQPTDGGHLLFTEKSLADFLKKQPEAKPYIKKLVGAKEYINNTKRYCLWLKNVSDEDIERMPYVKKRVEKVRAARLKQGNTALAQIPHLFREQNNPKTFMIIPSTSSENRDYVPFGFETDESIPTNAVLIIPEATLYHFGVLTSSVHMAWLRIIGGKLKSDYRYSKDIVYNNFPWPKVSKEQRQEISETAQAILDARKLYPNKSLADLYDKKKMPEELKKAHEKNDLAVLSLYGYSKDLSDEEIVKDLLKRYKKQLTPKNKRRGNKK